MLQAAILLRDSIRHDESCEIVRRYPNGVIVGRAYEVKERSHVAITVDTLKGTTALHPVVGEFRPKDSSWIFPAKPQAMVLKAWMRELCLTPRLEWLRRLKVHIQESHWIKVALEDYSIADVHELGNRGWFVGRSAHAPLWRIYALIPAALYERGELPYLDGMMRGVDRFGAIYDPARHELRINK